MGNPHLACVDSQLTVDGLAALDVGAPVSFDGAQFPDGVNVSTHRAGRRGGLDAGSRTRRGETRSCGTGTVAAAVAALAAVGSPTGTLTVHVPGGEVVVTVTDATSFLRGPSVLVARGDLADDWWNAMG